MVTKKAKKPAVKRSEVNVPVWQRGMNPEQLEVITHDRGPLRVLAAAGSGKTRAVVHRVVWLTMVQDVEPSRILGVTFSKKAAGEMNERLKALGVTRSRIGTWHSLALQILKEDRTEWGDWKVDDTNRAKYVLKDVLGWKGMDWKGADHTAISNFIGRCKANLFNPDSEEAMNLARKHFGFNAGRALEAFHKYNEALAEKRLLTFDDYLVFAALHLSDEENRLNWASKWDYVIQDEAQDENRAQLTIANLLSRDHRNYMVVGDVFQSIYSFRGSSPDYLATFEEEWPDAKTVWLGRNYRSGDTIIEAANGIVRPAKVAGHEPKDMVPSRGVPGKVQAKAGSTLDDEASNFVGWIQDLIENAGAEYSDITALFRTNAQSRALEEALLSARIPYVVVGGVSFYERKEVRDLLAYLRIAHGTGEVEDVKRCINAPFRFLGAAFVEKLMDRAENPENLTNGWPALVNHVANGAKIQSRQRASAAEWGDMIANISRRIIRGAAAREEAKGHGFDVSALLGSDDGAWATLTRDIKESLPSTILEDIVRRTRYLEWLTKEEGEESIETSHGANIREMIRVSERFATVGDFLRYIDDTIHAAEKQRKDGGAGGDRVLLMSIHRSKGLEWPHVWISGFNEMILPHAKGDPEEERRLAYVAATRARDTLVFSYVRTLATRAGIKDAAPSRFLLDSGVPLDLPKLGTLADAVLDESPEAAALAAVADDSPTRVDESLN